MFGTKYHITDAVTSEPKQGKYVVLKVDADTADERAAVEAALHAYAKCHLTNNNTQYVTELGEFTGFKFTNNDEDSRIVAYAKRELDRLVKNTDGDKDPEASPMQQHANNNILELLRVFSKQGHSGFSASYVLRLFNLLADFKPISPLTGADDEWGEPFSERNLQQNVRCSSVFRKNRDNSTATDNDRYVVSDDGGFSWMYGNRVAEKLGYKITIEFPYRPGSKPTKIYIKHTDKEIPGFFNDDDIVDITGNEAEIKALRERKLAEREQRNNSTSKDVQPLEEVAKKS